MEPSSQSEEVVAYRVPTRVPPPRILWQKIQRGECLAHEVQGKICLSGAQPSPSHGAKVPVSPPPPSTQKRQGASAAPQPMGVVAAKAAVEARQHPSESPAQALSGELKSMFHDLKRELSSGKTALVVDHLKLLREEKQVIITLAESYIQKVKMMSEDILAAKDEILALKEDTLQHLKTEVQELKRSLEESEKALARKQQEVEDLEVLNQALGPESSP